MIKITREPLMPESVVNEAKTPGSGCAVTYVGLIRDRSRDRKVKTVEYEDADGLAESKLRDIAEDIRQKWPVNGVSIYHRVGTLQVGDINLVVVIASAHRQEGFEACQYAIDRFKQSLPTRKKETYADGTVWTGE